MSQKPETDLLIMQKIESMIGYAYIALRQFPRHERNVLGAEIRRTMLEIVRLVVTAQCRYHKKTTLQDLDIAMKTLKHFVRLSYNLHYIDIKKLEIWSEKNTEIGRMIGGWIKSAQQSSAQ
jgi:four helix bundle protein